MHVFIAIFMKIIIVVLFVMFVFFLVVVGTVAHLLAFTIALLFF